MRKKLKKFDDYFINLINRRMKSQFLDIIMYYITKIGGALFSSILVLGMIFFGRTRIRTIGIESLVVLLSSQIIVHGLKIILSRERPYKIIKHLNTFGIDLKDYSFPSGHTTASFSIATTISLNIPELFLILISIATLVGISRIYLGVHYPTDVIAGLILGVVTPLIIHFYFLDYIYQFAETIGLK